VRLQPLSQQPFAPPPTCWYPMLPQQCECTTQILGHKSTWVCTHRVHTVACHLRCPLHLFVLAMNLRWVHATWGVQSVCTAFVSVCEFGIVVLVACACSRLPLNAGKCITHGTDGAAPVCDRPHQQDGACTPFVHKQCPSLCVQTATDQTLASIARVSAHAEPGASRPHRMNDRFEA
jgi:hypothetical protein